MCGLLLKRESLLGVRVQITNLWMRNTRLRGFRLERDSNLAISRNFVFKYGLWYNIITAYHMSSFSKICSPLSRRVDGPARTLKISQMSSFIAFRIYFQDFSHESC